MRVTYFSLLEVLLSSGHILDKMDEKSEPCNLMESLERAVMRKVCEYMDVTSLCRTDTATAVNRKARDAWLLGLKGMISPSMSKYHKHTNEDDFVALRWCTKRLIMLRKIRLCKIVDNRFFCPPCAYGIIPEDAHFQWLCANGKQEIAYLVVTSRSIDVNRVSSDSHYYQHIDECLEPKTPILHVAVEFGLTKVAKMLIYNGASMLLTSPSGFTCLHAGVRSRNHKSPRNIEAIKLLFEYSEAITLKDKPSDDGVTPLLLAIRRGSKKMVQVLLKYVDPNVCAPSDGLYPVSQCTSDEIRSLLVEAGAHYVSDNADDLTNGISKASNPAAS